jgi:hypothetical protein
MNNLYKTDDAALNDFLYCTQELNERPSKIVLSFNFEPEKFNQIISKFGLKVVNTFIEILPDAESNMTNIRNLIKLSDKFFVSYTHVDKTLPTGFIANLSIYHKIEDVEIVDKFVDNLNDAIEIEQEEETSIKCSFINNSAAGLMLQPMKSELLDPDNFDLYYNDDTLKSIKKLIKKINKNSKGLSIIHGKRGTGKTTLLKYIISEMDKECIFIPISMIDLSINAGGIKSLITPESVLIIDDCEILNADLYGKSSLTFANLLQLIDGLYSDEFNLNVILAFNIENEDDIDEELLESNNLINSIKLEELKKAKAKSLCEHLKLKSKIEEATLLIDIINNRIEDKTQTIGY